MKLRVHFLIVFLALAGAARAIPELQLDVLGGTYLGGSEESNVANSHSFTLRALLKGSSNLPSTYFVSAAIEPMLPQFPVPDVGSFSVNATSSVPTFSVNYGSTPLTSATFTAANMMYGTPPLDVSDAKLAGNLSPHGMYPTYYAEVQFQFSSTNLIGAYNTESHLGTAGSLYYADFAFNTSGLLPGYYVHFDLYDEVVKNGKYGVTYTLDDFAPFSHDARSMTGSTPSVPDSGSTLAMIGVVALSLVVLRRRRA